LSLIESLARTVNKLEIELIRVVQIATDHMNMAVAAKEEQVESAEACRAKIMSFMEDLHKLRSSNLELTLKNGVLEQELALARRDALLVRKELLIEKQAGIEKMIEMAKAGAPRDGADA